MHVRFFCLWLWQLICAVSSSAPVSLQSTDGQALIFRRLATKVALYGPFALVQNELLFENPGNRVLEGRFSFALPAGSIPNRFAMEIQGKWMEGEVLDKMKARKVYRSYLHVRVDPALLEQSQGNIFSARVFPIQPRAQVPLILSYAALVPVEGDVRQLVLPLQGLPELGEFALSTLIAAPGTMPPEASWWLPTVGVFPVLPNGGDGWLRAEVSMSSLVPDGNARLSVSAPAMPAVSEGLSLAVGNGALATLYRLGADAQVSNVTFTPSVWRIYIDTSASVADTFVVRNMMISALVDAAPQAQLEIFAFDMSVEELLSGTPSQGWGQAVRSALAARLPLGGTNFEALVDHISAIPSGRDVGVLVLSDAIPSVLTSDATLLGRRLAPAPGVIVQVGILGTKQNSAVSRSLAAAGSGRVVKIPLQPHGLEAVASSAWDEFRHPLGLRGMVQAQSGSWAWPLDFFDLHPGDEVIVFSGERGSGGSSVTVSPPQLLLQSAMDGSQPRTVTAATTAASSGFAELLRLETIRAELELRESERVQAPSAAQATQIRQEMVTLSETNRVLCDHTAMLVLENEQEYERHGISRTNLLPLLVVGPNGVLLQPRGSYSSRATTSGTTTTIAADNSSNTSSSTAPASTSTTTTVSTSTTATTTPAVSTTTDQAAANATNATAEEVEGEEEETDSSDPPARDEASGDAMSASAAAHRQSRPTGFAALAALHFVFFMASSSAASGSSGNSKSALSAIMPQRPRLGVLVVVAAAVTGSLLKGCDNHYEYGGGGDVMPWRGPSWTSPVTSARTTYNKYGSHGPAQRLREDWAEYSQSLWTLGRHEELLSAAGSWITWDPANTLAYEYLAQAAQALGQHATALRAATSVVEVAPRDSEQLLRGAWLLLALSSNSSIELGGRSAAAWARSFAERSVAERPDNPNAYRAWGLAAWRSGDLEGAAAAYAQGLAADIPSWRYGDWHKVLQEEAGLLLRTARLQNREMAALAAHNLPEDAGNDVMLRFTLSWLSDAATVDLHVDDPNGERCAYANTRTRWGLQYYKDVFPEGLGPQNIVLRGTNWTAATGRYKVGVHYYAQGSAGAARGTVVIWQIDPATQTPIGGVDGIGVRILPFTLPLDSNSLLPVADVDVV